MAPDDFARIQVAFAIVGAGAGFFVGKYARDHFQIDSAPGLLSLVGAVLFHFAAVYLLMLLFIAGAIGFARLLWRSRAVWMPHLEPLFRRFARWRRQSPSVAERLAREQDDFDARTEAVLTQPYPPDIKRSFLEQLETQHKGRVRGLLDNPNSSLDG